MIEKRFIDTGETRLHCNIAGPEDGALVVLLHGFPACAETWRAQLVALSAAGFRVVAPDQRGYGESDKPAGVASYSVTHLVADVIGIVDSFKREKAFVVGHDFGGGVASLFGAIASGTWILSSRLRRLIGYPTPASSTSPKDPIGCSTTRQKKSAHCSSSTSKASKPSDRDRGRAMKFDAARRFFPALALSFTALACGGAAPPPATSVASPASASVAPPVASASGAAHFTYANADGPDHWGDLDPKFALCKNGTKQSPINLPVVLRSDSSVAITAPTYAPIPLAILNNGHTIQVKNSGAAASITLDGVKYDLAQFHFHSPSEHTIGGKSFEMEMHLVHKSADGKLLVVALMFTKGAENKALKPVWDSLPSDISETPTSVPNMSIDIASLLPAEIKFEHYEGSLTTPPCSESVSWFVVERPAHGGLEMSGDQIARYRALLHGPTNRPVQPLNGRAVVEVSGAH